MHQHIRKLLHAHSAHLYCSTLMKAFMLNDHVQKFNYCINLFHAQHFRACFDSCSTLYRKNCGYIVKFCGQMSQRFYTNRHCERAEWKILVSRKPTYSLYCTTQDTLITEYVVQNMRYQIVELIFYIGIFIDDHYLNLLQNTIQD